MAFRSRERYPFDMSLKERLVVCAWVMNLAAVCGLNVGDVGHCLGILVLYSAAYFLFAPLHALMVLCGWFSYLMDKSESAGIDSVALRAAGRVILAETLAFWLIYWGMVLDFVPLHLRI